MINTEFLFPETINQNPFSFVKLGVQTCNDPVPIDGYKLILFFSRLDNPNYPYFVAPMECKGSKTYFYKFYFINSIPDFQKIGLKTKAINSSQTIIYFDSDYPLEDSNEHIIIESGNWSNEFGVYNKFAALKHVDVISNVNEMMIQNPEILNGYMQSFHKLYGIDMDLNELYKETKFLLDFFDFKVENFDSDFCFFGCFKTPIEDFIRKCFPNFIFGDLCLTPSIFKQLLSFKKFVMLSLHKLKYGCNEDLNSIILALNQYQKDNKLKIGKCTEETMSSIFRNILLKSNDPMKTLNDVNVSAQFSILCENAKLGELDLPKYEKYQSNIIITQLSNLISDLDSPTNLVASYQKQFIDTLKSTLNPLKSINDTINFIENKLNSSIQKTNSVSTNLNHSFEDTESIINSVNKITETSSEINLKISRISKSIKSETKTTKILLILFLLLIFIFAIQNIKFQSKVPFTSKFLKSIKSSKVAPKLHPFI